MARSYTTKKDIPDVGMDKYNLPTGYLARTGANPCRASSDRIFLVQRISKCSVDILIGAMILEPLSHKTWFAMSRKTIDAFKAYQRSGAR
ncbi:unnamed protein product [Rotaria socialis]|uniref:Uncharacterized protein n=1 Tax=Rotaria socialis TaxID=392032 RepID=A0A820YMB1_9BILA|nr:unnamed protein product [Rotaria socialis]CAF4552233.1 unnamed protein product [Rotaria socialis]